MVLMISSNISNMRLLRWKRFRGEMLLERGKLPCLGGPSRNSPVLRMLKCCLKEPEGGTAYMHCAHAQ